MISYIGKWRNRGFTEGEIETQAQALNATSPNPLPAQEVTAMRLEYSEQNKSAETRFPMTDLGNAERLVSQHGDVIRYSYERKLWLVWQGSGPISRPYCKTMAIDKAKCEILII